MKRQKLRRDHPEPTGDEIEARVAAWLRDRPGADFGDAVGRRVNLAPALRVNRIEVVLRAATTDLAELRLRWALVDGLAVSARTEPRFTRDVDLVIAVPPIARIIHERGSRGSSGGRGGGRGDGSG